MGKIPMKAKRVNIGNKASPDHWSRNKLIMSIHLEEPASISGKRIASRCLGKTENNQGRIIIIVPIIIRSDRTSTFRSLAIYSRITKKPIE
jgi:hypothetical protein